MLNWQFFRSTAFRLALVYAVLFSISITILIGFMYLATLREMQTQIQSYINVQLSDLSDVYKERGKRVMVHTLKERIDEEKEKMTIYMFSRDGDVLVGNIDRMPAKFKKRGEWLYFRIYRAKLPPDHWPLVMATERRIGNYNLLVGYKLNAFERAQEVMLRVMGIGVGMALLLALAGGWIVSLVIRKRLERINRICVYVMRGALNKRVPMSGSGDAFDDLAGNFNAMLSRISELIEGVQHISSNIAHDLRTPLNRLRGRLEQLERHPPSEEVLASELHLALAEIDALTQTFNAILRISQAETGAGKEMFTPTDLSELTESVAEFYGPLAEEKELSIAISISPGIIIKGDKPLLTQALANLFDNAVKYSPHGGVITVRLVADKTHAFLTLTDSGPGIPPEYYDKVTERFFRLEKSRGTPGNGLGLSLVKAAFSLHEAMLTFNDNAPGLSVKVTFPLFNTAD